MKLFVGPIPWEKLNRADFQNWPEDVPVERPNNLAHVHRQKLNDVLERVQLSDHFKKTYKMRLGYSISEKRAFISRHLLNLIKEHTGLSYFHLPRIYPGEITHWSSSKSVNPKKLSASDLDYVFQNLHSVELSDSCLERLKTSPKSKSAALLEEFRQFVLDMLNAISDKRNNIKVFWSKIQRDSFTWWPAAIQVIDPAQLSAADLRTIIENKDQINFTDDFKREYLNWISRK